LQQLLLEFAGHPVLGRSGGGGFRETCPCLIDCKLALHLGGTRGNDAKINKQVCRDQVQGSVLANLRPQFADQDTVAITADSFKKCRITAVKLIVCRTILEQR